MKNEETQKLNKQESGQEDSVNKEEVNEELPIDGPSSNATYGIVTGRGSAILKVGDK